MRGKIYIRTLCYLFVAAMACGAVMAGDLVKAPGRKTTGPVAPNSVTANRFGGNLEVNTCTLCNFDEINGGYYVWGSMNCISPGTTQWIGVPFISKITGVPRRITAGIEIDPDCPTSTTQVTLSIYTDDCTTGPGVVLASGRALVSAGPCVVAIANLRTAPSLTAGTRYWVVATTSSTQNGFDGIWYGSNQSQIGGNVASGGWFFFNGFVPSFSVD